MSLATLDNAFSVPLNRIEPNPFQPRQHFDADELSGLTQSIKEQGVIQPVLLRPHPTRPGWYQLVSGERRVRASENAGKKQVPAIVRDLDDLQAQEIALQENIQRQSLTDFEEATGIYRLWQTYEASGMPLSKRGLAEKLGKAVTYVSNRLDALGYHDDVKELMMTQRHVLSSAKAINSVKDDERRKKYIEMVKRNASFVEITSAIQRDEAEIKLRNQANKAPDDETNKRANRAAEGDTASMSRGRMVTSSTRREANQEVQRALLNLEAWITKCDKSHFDKAHALARRIIRGDLSR